MNQSATGFDFDRYRKLLAQANDEPKRLALIKLLIDEKVKDRLAQQSLRSGATEPGTKDYAKTDPKTNPKADKPDLRPKPDLKPDLRPRDVSSFSPDLFRERIAQAYRSIEHGTIRR